MDHVIKMIPLLIFMGILIFLIFRMNRSMRIQKEAADRQKTGMDLMDYSLKRQAEGIQIGKEQKEVLESILVELKEIKSALTQQK